MNITEPFVLKRDVELIPCTDLSDDVRRRITFEDGDYTLSLRHGRALAQVIDGETAALLSLFREPHTIADAVIEKSRVFRKDPEVWLDELLPHLGKFLQNRVLVPAGADDEHELRPQYESGAAFGRWEVVRCAHLVEDTEVYQLRCGEEVAALKASRVDTPLWQRVFANELAVLRHLDGTVAPRVLESGERDGKPYLIADWMHGVDAGTAAAQRRHDRAAAIELCAAIAEAYARLHENGVLHADVHPRNVLIGDEVTLLDFGYSRVLDQEARIGRGGLYYFFEPEYVVAQREGIDLPSTAAGEQYSIAAMLYLLLTGHHYADFRFDREEMYRQVEHEGPAPFASRGIPPWSDVEAILFRALEKDPASRHASIREMATLLAAARDKAVAESLDAPLSETAHALLETTLQSLARGGTTFASRYPSAPRASINYGCAGAAIGLLRIASTRSDPALLALADVWRSRAATMMGNDDAYYDDGNLSHDSLGDVSPYHTESGIHAAGAMIAAAMGDALAQRGATAAFVRAASKPCEELDLALGRSATLLGASLLLPLGEDAALRAFGSSTMAAIWSSLDTRPPIDASPSGTYLGMAHGWAGYLYAALRWCAASGDALPPRLLARLEELAALRIAKGRCAYWRIVIDGPVTGMMPGWCNGSAGHLFLFTLAHRMLGDARWRELAELCAWNCWDEPCGPTTLCCGTAGRAYALLDFYKLTGGTAWLSRARQLANHAASAAKATSQRENALWKGELGVAVLIADLASPENARMPFFD